MIEIGPGMTRKLRCSECDGPLAVDDTDRCAQCRPQLSVTAEAVGKVRKQQRDELRTLELATDELETMLKQLHRKVRLNGYRRNPEGHSRHPRKIAGNLEAGGRAQDKLVGGETPHQSGARDTGNTEG